MKTKKINKETAQARRLAVKYRNLYIRFKAEYIAGAEDMNQEEQKDTEKTLRIMEKLPWGNR